MLSRVNWPAASDVRQEPCLRDLGGNADRCMAPRRLLRTEMIQRAERDECPTVRMGVVGGGGGVMRCWEREGEGEGGPDKEWVYFISVNTPVKKKKEKKKEKEELNVSGQIPPHVYTLCVCQSVGLSALHFAQI